MTTAIDTFNAHDLRAQNDKLLDIPELIHILLSIFERLAEEQPTLVNIPLCTDLTLNWMLNVYDP